MTETSHSSEPPTPSVRLDGPAREAVPAASLHMLVLTFIWAGVASVASLALEGLATSATLVGGALALAHAGVFVFGLRPDVAPWVQLLAWGLKLTLLVPLFFIVLVVYKVDGVGFAVGISALPLAALHLGVLQVWRSWQTQKKNLAVQKQYLVVEQAERAPACMPHSRLRGASHAAW